jgi:hypothetical protein
MITEQLRPKDVAFIMSRYDHDNPRRQMQTSFVAKLIGMTNYKAARILYECEKQGLVTCHKLHTKNGTKTLWSANEIKL